MAPEGGTAALKLCATILRPCFQYFEIARERCHSDIIPVDLLCPAGRFRALLCQLSAVSRPVGRVTAMPGTTGTYLVPR